MPNKQKNEVRHNIRITSNETISIMDAICVQTAFKIYFEKKREKSGINLTSLISIWK